MFLTSTGSEESELPDKSGMRPVLRTLSQLPFFINYSSSFNVELTVLKSFMMGHSSSWFR